MNLAPWRTPLSHAIQRNRSNAFSRYFQLATVTPDGKPANRTVVFRGFIDNTNQLKIVTDTRSKKVEQIRYQDWGEICWYFTETREQFRLAGNLILVTEDYPDDILSKEWKDSWQNLSDGARSQFIWSHPGKVRKPDDPCFNSSPPDAYNPVPNFALLIFTPQSVDHLELRGDPQNRCLYTLNSSSDWVKEVINP